MSQQAVYDVLRAPTAAGLVRRIQPPGSVARYESRVGDSHHHAVCRSYGAIADVDGAVGTAPCLTEADPSTATPSTRPRLSSWVAIRAVLLWLPLAAESSSSPRKAPPSRGRSFRGCPCRCREFAARSLALLPAISRAGRRGVARIELRGPQAAPSLAPIHSAASTQPSKQTSAPPPGRLPIEVRQSPRRRSQARRQHDRSVTNAITAPRIAG